MRFLLFFICFLFSTIFFVFHHISLWKDFFWFKLKKIALETFSWNLLFESFIFLLIWIFFVVYFSPNLKPNFILDKVEKNKKNFYIIYYILLFLFIFSWKIFYDTFVLFSIIFFIFSDLSFNILSNLNNLKEQKENLRYFWLFLNFSSSFISLYYIFNFDFSIILFLILIFNLFFNYFIYQKYKNIACLTVVYTIIIFVLLFFILKLYYLIKFILNFN